MYRIKIGDEYLEYVTSDTIGITRYPEAAQTFTKEDAAEVAKILGITVEECGLV